MTNPVDVPLGFWLRTVDGLFDSSMDASIAEKGATRHLWQVLSTVRRNEPVETAIVADAMAMSLRGRNESAQNLIEELRLRGWIEERDGFWSVTEKGQIAYAELEDGVAALRERMFKGVDEDAYRTTVETLARIRTNLDPDGGSALQFR